MTVRRLKTYTGSQGYVYQYYFVGKRPFPAPDSDRSKATEYIFNVTSDRKLTYSVSIFLPDSVAAGWAQSHGTSAIRFRAIRRRKDAPVSRLRRT